MASVVAILQSGFPPKYKHQNIVINKTVLNISTSLSIPEGYMLAIKTPTFIKPLIDNNFIPSSKYPQLIQQLKDPDPESLSKDYAFQIIPKSDKKFFFLILQVICKDNIDIPPFVVRFIYTEFKKLTGKDVFFRIVEQFELEVNNPQVFVGKTLLNQNLSAYEIFDLAEKFQFSFSCSLKPESIKLIQTREKILKELYDTEVTYCFGLNTLYNHFRQKMIEAKIVNESNMNLIFGQLPK